MMRGPKFWAREHVADMPSRNMGNEITGVDPLKWPLCPPDRPWTYKQQAGLNRHLRRAHSQIGRELELELEPEKKKKKKGEIIEK